MDTLYYVWFVGQTEHEMTPFLNKDSLYRGPFESGSSFVRQLRIEGRSLKWQEGIVGVVVHHWKSSSVGWGVPVCRFPSDITCVSWSYSSLDKWRPIFSQGAKSPSLSTVNFSWTRTPHVCFRRWTTNARFQFRTGLTHNTSGWTNQLSHERIIPVVRQTRPSRRNTYTWDTSGCPGCESTQDTNQITRFPGVKLNMTHGV